MTMLCVMMSQVVWLSGQGVSDRAGQQPMPEALASASRVKPVFVLDVETGREFSGHLLGVEAETLRLSTNGGVIELPLARVARIEVLGHAVTKAARIGALVGGLWCAVVCGQGGDRPTAWFKVIGVNAAFGAAIGAGIGAAIPGRMTIYERAPVTVAHRMAWFSWRF
jgi:hypothetical protein